MDASRWSAFAGQGHPGHQRALRPSEQVDRVVVHVPEQCHGCGAGLQVDSKRTLLERWQWTEVPELGARLEEHRAYEVRCTGCGQWSKPKRVRHAKGAGFGPRLQALLALLSGQCRVSREQSRAFVRSVFGIELSEGAVYQCERRVQRALSAVVDDAQAYLQGGSLLHMDETGWKEAGELKQLWTMGAGPLSVLRIQDERSSEAARAMLGSFKGLLTTDRLSSYAFWDERKRQVCWAHIRRELQAIVEHRLPGQRIAKRLLGQLRMMFRQWGRIRDGTVPLDARSLMAPIFGRITHWLERGRCSRGKRLRVLCKGLLKLPHALDNFVRIPGAEPTNNRAERDLRHGVIWRKTSFGTRSAAGSRYAECMLSVVASLRAQGRDVYDFLVRRLQAYLFDTHGPLLTP